MKKKIVVLPGDGIGQEVTKEAVKVLHAVANQFGLEFELMEYLIGGASLEAYDVPIRDEVVENCKTSAAVLLGAVGGPKWDDLPKDKRPEVDLLKLRKEPGLFTNLRPEKCWSR